jgi:hypothetical protein
MNSEDKIKLFAMSNQLVERDLDKVEKAIHIDLGRELIDNKDEEYYPQFQEMIRADAASMSRHYELFFCLENSIRSLIKSKLEAEYDSGWWEKAVPEDVRKQADGAMKRELAAGVSQRSTQEIDYTNFGDLSTIVTKNWSIFSDTFNDMKAFQRVMSTLNILRGPIAHCTPFQEDEVVRLGLLIRDWFRLME